MEGRKHALIIGKCIYDEKLKKPGVLSWSTLPIASWMFETVERTNLFFDNDEELTVFWDEVSELAVELYRKKYNKEETK